jgi:beta-glucuronidase
MVQQHINHPCIYVWGLLNECESETEFGRETYAAQIKQLRGLDPSRPITFASCRHFNDVCLDLVDIVSFNIYPQWYLKESTDEWTAKEIAWMETAGAKNKPIIFSEFGAGGIAGFHDPFSRVKWSEERQADILEEQLTSLLGNPRVAGTYIWQFCDVRTSEETAWCMRRPKVENNKGVVDLYRKPKLSYNTVKAAYTAKNEF